MKHIIIGDLHGRDTWKQAPLESNAKIVFLGDYVDSYKRSDHEILLNLQEIIAFKKANSERVILLVGNHDVQYMHYPHNRCAGFRPSAQSDLTNLFNENKHHFQLAYQVRNVLFTHAGLTNTWFRKFKTDAIYKKHALRNLPLANTLNQVYRITQNSILYAPCRYRTGEDSDGGPLWADRYATFHDALNGYHQIVGHTPIDEPMAHVWPGKSITYLDLLHRIPYFHEIHI